MRADRGDVGAGVGLGDRDRTDLRALDRGTQPALPLVVGPELREGGRGHVRLHRNGHRDRARTTTRQLLDEDQARRRGHRHSRPSATGKCKPEEAELTAPAEDVVGEVPRVLPLDDVRPDLGVDEPADGSP